MTEKEAQKYIEEKMTESSPNLGDLFTIVTDEEKKVYAFKLEYDYGGVPNWREEEPDGLFSTIFIAKDSISREYVKLGDAELTPRIEHTLYDKREDPDWVILPLSYRIPPVSTGNLQLEEYRESECWVDEEREEGVCGFITTYKRKWLEKTGYKEEDWDREKVKGYLRGELHVYNQYLAGEAYGARLYQWRPRTFPLTPEDVTREAQFEELENGNCGGFPPDELYGIVTFISDMVGTDAWHDYDPKKDRIDELTKKFVVKTFDCPVCGEVGGIAGIVYPTSFYGVCEKCGATLTTNKPYHKK